MLLPTFIKAEVACRDVGQGLNQGELTDNTGQAGLHLLKRTALGHSLQLLGGIIDSLGDKPPSPCVSLFVSP